MTREEHIERHKYLHKCLDELVCDFIQNTGGRPSETTLLEFMLWSNSQTENPGQIDGENPLGQAGYSSWGKSMNTQ